MKIEGGIILTQEEISKLLLELESILKEKYKDLRITSIKKPFKTDNTVWYIKMTIEKSMYGKIIYEISKNMEKFVNDLGYDYKFNAATSESNGKKSIVEFYIYKTMEQSSTPLDINVPPDIKLLVEKIKKLLLGYINSSRSAMSPYKFKEKYDYTVEEGVDKITLYPDEPSTSAFPVINKTQISNHCESLSKDLNMDITGKSLKANDKEKTPRRIVLYIKPKMSSKEEKPTKNLKFKPNQKVKVTWEFDTGPELGDVGVITICDFTSDKFDYEVEFQDGSKWRLFEDELESVNDSPNDDEININKGDYVLFRDLRKTELKGIITKKEFNHIESSKEIYNYIISTSGSNSHSINSHNIIKKILFKYKIGDKIKYQDKNGIITFVGYGKYDYEISVWTGIENEKKGVQESDIVLINEEKYKKNDSNFDSEEFMKKFLTSVKTYFPNSIDFTTGKTYVKVTSYDGCIDLYNLSTKIETISDEIGYKINTIQTYKDRKIEIIFSVQDTTIPTEVKSIRKAFGDGFANEIASSCREKFELDGNRIEDWTVSVNTKTKPHKIKIDLVFVENVPGKKSISVRNEIEKMYDVTIEYTYIPLEHKLKMTIIDEPKKSDNVPDKHNDTSQKEQKYKIVNDEINTGDYVVCVDRDELKPQQLEFINSLPYHKVQGIYRKKPTIGIENKSAMYDEVRGFVAQPVRNPAYAAGIPDFAVILNVNSTPVNKVEDVTKALMGIPNGEKVKVEYTRNNRDTKVLSKEVVVEYINLLDPTINIGYEKANFRISRFKKIEFVNDNYVSNVINNDDESYSIGEEELDLKIGDYIIWTGDFYSYNKIEVKNEVSKIDNITKYSSSVPTYSLKLTRSLSKPYMNAPPRSVDFVDTTSIYNATIQKTFVKVKVSNEKLKPKDFCIVVDRKNIPGGAANFLNKKSFFRVIISNENFTTIESDGEIYTHPIQTSRLRKIYLPPDVVKPLNYVVTNDDIKEGDYVVFVNKSDMKETDQKYQMISASPYLKVDERYPNLVRIGNYTYELHRVKKIAFTGEDTYDDNIQFIVTKEKSQSEIDNKNIIEKNLKDYWVHNVDFKLAIITNITDGENEKEYDVFYNVTDNVNESKKMVMHGAKAFIDSYKPLTKDTVEILKKKIQDLELDRKKELDELKSTYEKREKIQKQPLSRRRDIDINIFKEKLEKMKRQELEKIIAKYGDIYKKIKRAISKVE